MKTRVFTAICAAGLLTAVSSITYAVEPGAVTQNASPAQISTFVWKTANHIDIKIQFYRDDVFRIQAAPDSQFADPKNDPEKAQIVIVDSPEKVGLNMKEDDGSVIFTTPKLTLTLDKKTSRFTLARPNGEVIWKELKPLDLTEKLTVQTLSTTEDEHFFGGGQQNGHFTHKGTQIEIRADGNWNEGGKPNPAPFYVSSKGYGVLRNTFSPGHYDFTEVTNIKLDHQENRFDAYYFVGPDFKRVVDLYTQFTGRPNFVPIWALELGEADAYMTRDPKTKELLKNPDGSYVETTPDCIDRLAKKYREHDMPGGWILPNDGYGCEYTQLPYVVKELHKLGFYTGLWTQRDLDKTEWEVGTAGIRAQKLDVAWTGPAYQFSLDANRQAWTSLTTNSNSRGFVWTVQGWAGTQRYSVCWTGDQYGSWDLIRYHIPTLIGSGMSGQAYATTDIDGIFGGSPETYTRDLQWKCFTPVLYAMNGWAGKISKSPWAYEEPFISINRKYLKLKMRLTPYMYKYTREAYDTGAPIVRGMVWEFPGDEKTYDRSTQHQYMLGEHLLIAPVFTSGKINKGWRKEDIYLPEGNWVDYWDGRRITGPTTIDNYPAPLEKLPILVKAGAIIPMYPEMLYNNQKPKDPLTFDIYPHGESEFLLYEDDGLTRKHQQGEFARQLIKVNAPRNTEAGDIRITLEPPKGRFDGQLETRVYQFQVHVEAKPEKVVMNAALLPEYQHKDDLDHAGAGWCYDPNDRRGILYIKAPRRDVKEKFLATITINDNQKIEPSPPYPVPEITPDIDKTQLIVTASSQHGGGPITNAFDGTPETIWHSNYGKKNPGKYPYEVNINLGGLYAVNGFHYLPRPNGGNGMLKDYEVYVSRSQDTFGEPIAKGSFSEGTELKKIKLPTTWGEFIRLRFLNSQHGPDHTHAAAAEFDFTQDLKAPPLKDVISYLSDLKPASSKGAFKNDQSFGGKTITVNGQSYKKGIGAMSGSEIVYELDGSWDKLSGHVGMDDEVGDSGTVMFRVYADGKVIFESPVQTGKSVKQLMELNLKGVKELRLVLLDTGDGSENDHGDWVDAKLIRKGSE
ncbi:MAG: NPCBM/NEW2 domain-containing protein [Akkermansiaceae bacterium]|nr:NPCBM/NEW2 domain-containing protein [Akkermansiaceae bacterium]